LLLFAFHQQLRLAYEFLYMALVTRTQEDQSL